MQCKNINQEQIMGEGKRSVCWFVGWIRMFVSEQLFHQLVVRVRIRKVQLQAFGFLVDEASSPHALAKIFAAYVIIAEVFTRLLACVGAISGRVKPAYPVLSASEVIFASFEPAIAETCTNRSFQQRRLIIWVLPVNGVSRTAVKALHAYHKRLTPATQVFVALSPGEIVDFLDRGCG